MMTTRAMSAPRGPLRPVLPSSSRRSGRFVGRSASASRVEEILLLHHSHLDVGYTHSQPIVWELQQEFLSQAVDWLEQTADLPEPSRPKWTGEATEPVPPWPAAAPGDQ